MKKTLKIYAVGGAGCNIGQKFVKNNNGNTPDGFANIEVVFIDTSRSNIISNVPNEQVYLFEGLDGSGKHRPSNHIEMSEKINDILLQHKPSDINVIVGSTSGGSGSVLGPLLTNAMVKRDIPVVNVLIGSNSSKKEIENNYKTLMSYEKIAIDNEKPVVAFYRENTVDTPRGKVDFDIEQSIILLSILFSGENRELDTADYKNLLNYTTVTTFKPRLSLMEVLSETVEIGKNQVIVSSVTLSDANNSYEIPVKTEYHANGIVPEGAKEFLASTPLPIHYCVINGYFNEVISRLEKAIRGYEETRAAYVDKPIVSNNVSSTNDGLIL